jgi:hypothetical protein
MKQRIPSRTLSIALALVLSLALLVAPPAGGPLSASASHGHEVAAVQVSLVPCVAGSPRPWRIAR